MRGRLSSWWRVSFRYDPGSPVVLQDITMSIPPGARVAIVGTSGAGKTTLALLILGLYSPTSGTICLGGTDLATLDPRIVRAQTGTVLQDPFVFSGTIAANIAFHDPAIAPADIEQAARLACLHSDIVALPRGYQTRLAERGGGLSGGQRQRLAIARALVRHPAMLLLDEATSHLDAVTEAAIYRNLSTLDCTQILIAHRLSTVRDADLIMVLHDGTITEAGPHADLLSRGGGYASPGRRTAQRPRRHFARERHARRARRGHADRTRLPMTPREEVKIMTTTEAALEPDISAGAPEQVSDVELDDIVGGAAPGAACCACTA